MHLGYLGSAQLYLGYNLIDCFFLKYLVTYPPEINHIDKENQLNTTNGGGIGIFSLVQHDQDAIATSFGIDRAAGVRVTWRNVAPGDLLLLGASQSSF